MKAVLIRTGSSPLHNSSSSSLLIHGSPKISMSYHDSVTGILFSGKNDMNSPKSLHFEIKQKNNLSSRSIRRAYSESDMFGSVDTGYGLSRMRSRSFPAIIPEEDEDVCDEDGDLKGSVMLKSNEDLSNELDFFSGGGIGTKFSGGNGGGGGGGGDEIGGDKSKIGANYVEMLKMDPGNSLLLRNYGKFLHEVEKNAMKAEEYYSRAILANPGDGEVLSLYGKLIWETQKDRTRAKSYFDRSIQVAPSDCFVMGAYAHFLWDIELDEDEEEEETQVTNITTSSSAMVEAF